MVRGAEEQTSELVGDQMRNDGDCNSTPSGGAKMGFIHLIFFFFFFFGGGGSASPQT